MSIVYPCVYCTDDGYCKKYSDDMVTSWCVQSPCKDEKPSNADRIRAMSDEELAEWIGEVTDGGFSMCAPCWLEWLREEATE